MKDYEEIKTPYGTFYKSTKQNYNGWIRITPSGDGIETRNKRFSVKLPHKIILLVQKFLLWRARKTNTQYVGVLWMPYITQTNMQIDAIVYPRDSGNVYEKHIDKNMYTTITLDAELTEKGKEVFDNLKKNSSL